MRNELKSKYGIVGVGVEAKHFVRSDANYLLDPANIRHGFELVGINLPTLSERVIEAAKKTIDNNSDSGTLCDSIFEEGFDESCQNIKVMDVVDYSYGCENVENILKFYEERKDLCDLVKMIDEDIKNGKPLSSLAKYREKFFIVLGGNTRVSQLILAYNDFTSDWESNGSVEYKIPAVVVEYKYSPLLHEDKREFVDKMTNREIRDLRKEFQLAYELMALQDNALRNNDNSPAMRAKGRIAEQMIEWHEVAAGKKLDSAREKVSAWQTMYNKAGVNPGELIKALNFYKLYGEKKEMMNIDGTESLSKNNFFKNTANEKVCSIYAKVTNALIGKANPSKEERKIAEAIGVDYKTNNIVDLSKATKYVVALTKAKENANGKDASYIANPLKEAANKLDPESDDSCARWLDKAINSANKYVAEDSKCLLNAISEKLLDIRNRAEKSPSLSVVITLDEIKELVRIVRAIKKGVK